MSKTIEKTCWLVGLQGHTNVPDHELRAIDYGLRTAPAFCMILTAMGTVLGSPLLLGSLAGIAALAVWRRANVFDVVYNNGLRYVLKGPKLPPYQTPRRFACTIASLWLLITVGLMLIGYQTAGEVMGWLLVVTAGIPVTTGFCVPSFIYRLITRSMPVRAPHVHGV